MLSRMLFIIFFSISSYAQDSNCELSNSLLNTTCSDDWFRPKNLKELTKYLEKGKYKDGKLLNLELSFNLEEREINLGMPCNLRIMKGISLYSKKNGICISARNVEIRGLSFLKADKKGPINILASHSIELKKAHLETKGEIILKTTVFSPFEEGVHISRNSFLKGSDKIKVDSASNLLINDRAKIFSNELILNGGNCLVREDEDDELSSRGLLFNSFKKFKHSYQYTGTCKDNNVTKDIVIKQQLEEDGSFRFSSSEENSDYQFIWKVDNEVHSINTLNHYFYAPGVNRVDLIVQSKSSGFYRKFYTFVKVIPKPFYKSEPIIFAIKNAPSPMIHSKDWEVAFLGKKMVKLKFSEEIPGYYYIDGKDIILGTRLLKIPRFNYSQKITIKDDPVIMDYKIYLSEYFEKEKASADPNLLMMISQIERYINSLSESDKKNASIALEIQRLKRIESTSSSNTTSSIYQILKKALRINAFADDIETSDVKLEKEMKESVKEHVKLVSKLKGECVVLSGTGLALLIEKSAVQAIGAISIALGFYRCYQAMTKASSAYDKILMNVYEVKPLSLLLDSNQSAVKSGEVSSIILGSLFTTFKNSYQTLTGVVLQQNVKQFNNQIALYRTLNNSVVAFLEKTGITLPIINDVTFATTNFKGTLNSHFARVYSKKGSISNNIDVSIVRSYLNEIDFKIESDVEQDIRMTIEYNNPELNVLMYKDIVFKVTTDKPKAFFTYKQGKKYLVNFDSTDPENPSIEGLTYHWTFGEGTEKTTPFKALVHEFPGYGEYTVTLSVSDEKGNTDTYTQNIYINQAPSLQISPTYIESKIAKFRAYISNISLDGRHNIVWNFGDGSQSVIKRWDEEVFHEYLDYGQYQVTAILMMQDTHEEIASNQQDLILSDLYSSHELIRLESRGNAISPWAAGFRIFGLSKDKFYKVSLGEGLLVPIDRDGVLENIYPQNTKTYDIQLQVFHKATDVEPFNIVHYSFENGLEVALEAWGQVTHEYQYWDRLEAEVDFEVLDYRETITSSLNGEPVKGANLFNFTCTQKKIILPVGAQIEIRANFNYLSQRYNFPDVSGSKIVAIPQKEYRDKNEKYLFFYTSNGAAGSWHMSGGLIKRSNCPVSFESE